MDEEEELENTLIGQEEEAPAVNTADIIMGAGIPASAFGQAPAVNPFSMEAAGQVNPMMQQQSLEAPVQPQVTFRDYSVPESPRTADLSVFTPSGDLRSDIDVNAITPAPTTLPVPSDVSTALNQEVAVGSPSVESQPSQPSQPREARKPKPFGSTPTAPIFFEPGGFGYEYLGPRLGTNLGEFAGEQLYGTGITAEGQATGFPVDRPSLAGDILTLPGNVLRGLDFVAGPPVRAIPGVTKALADYTTGATGVQAQKDAQAARAAQAAQDAEATPTAASQFLTPDPLVLPSETIGQIPSVNPFSLESAEQVNPISQAVNEIPILGATQGQEATALPLNQTLSQFMRNEDSPEQRTEQFVDPQGRLRRRLTPEASALQGFAPGVQPLAPEYTGFEEASADLQERLRANQRRPGESQAERDTRAAQSRTTGGQTEGLSFDDARRRAEGQLAARGIRNPSASQVNALARSIQVAEPERLAELETQRALTQGRIDALDAQLAQSGIVPSAPPVIDPETGVITQTYTDGTTRYKGLTRVIEDTPEKTGLQATLENLQSDLDSGRLTQEEYDIASKNAKDRYIGREEPKPAKPEETSGLIDMDGEGSGTTSVKGADASDVKSFATEAEARASGVKGEVLIGGRRAVIE